VKRGRDRRSRPRAGQDLPRVHLAFADAPRDLIEVELEDLAQQEDGALSRREVLQQDEEPDLTRADPDRPDDALRLSQAGGASRLPV